MTKQLHLFDVGTPPVPSRATAVARDQFGTCVGCGRLICQCRQDGRSQPLARRSDPQPSHEAAKSVEVRLSRHQATVWSAIQMMVEPQHGAKATVTCRTEGGESVAIELGDHAYTAREIAVFAKEELDPSTTIETLRKRVPELARDVLGGIVSSTDVPQKCRITGKNATGFTINRTIKAVVRTADGS